MSKNKFPYAVVLDIAFSGYGALRSLVNYKIPLIGFYNSKSLPESYTRLCDRKIYYKDTDELLKQLIELSEGLDKVPVLILTTDFYVEFYVKNRLILESKFLINMPDKETVELLMDKNRFSAFSLDHDILIPRSFEVRNEEDLDKIKSQIIFPAIVKPYKRTEEWENARCKKAYIVPDYNKLIKLYKSVSGIEPYLILQQYIDGADDCIEYCLTYFSKRSECLMAFTGKKIRQWPVGTGSTATTMPVDNIWMKSETERIFKAVKYIGFGSIEYKRNEYDGKYYLMEPTVGRLNQQEYVATLSGYNIPLIGYCDLTGIAIEPLESIKYDMIYIDEVAEICSVYVHLKRKLLSIPQWIKTLKGRRYYRYANKKDKYVFGGLLIKIVAKLFSR